MASAWGSSWASAWGSSWGSVSNRSRGDAYGGAKAYLDRVEWREREEKPTAKVEKSPPRAKKQRAGPAETAKPQLVEPVNEFVALDTTLAALGPELAGAIAALGNREMIVNSYADQMRQFAEIESRRVEVVRQQDEAMAIMLLVG